MIVISGLFIPDDWARSSQRKGDVLHCGTNPGKGQTSSLTRADHLPFISVFKRFYANQEHE